MASGVRLEAVPAEIERVYEGLIKYHTYDNVLYHMYGGVMNEGSAGGFSRRTVLAAVDALEGITQAEFSRFLFHLGPEFPRWVPGEPLSLAKRLNELMALYDQRPDRRLADGEWLGDAIVVRAVACFPKQSGHSMFAPPVELPSTLQALKRSMELDGFVLTDGSLRRTLPEDIGLPAAESELVRLLKVHGFAIAQGHLDQALDTHTRGKWAAANAQLRTFLDALLDEIVERLDASTSVLGTGQPRRAKLASLGFLSIPLNEWDNSGKGFINGLVKRLHPQGSHPGLSDQEDSTFRLHIVLLTAGLLLRRFDQRVAS